MSTKTHKSATPQKPTYTGIGTGSVWFIVCDNSQGANTEPSNGGLRSLSLKE